MGWDLISKEQEVPEWTETRNERIDREIKEAAERFAAMSDEEREAFNTEKEEEARRSYEGATERELR